MAAVKTIDDVRAFWENAPLFHEESSLQPGTREFFAEHSSVVVGDCFAGRLDERVFPKSLNQKVLDLGCGPGFWSIELARRGHCVTAADLTVRALDLTRSRAASAGVHVETAYQNAEALTFESEAFDHVNCQGVIHHTPNTEACIREVSRVLRSGGTASISVYYRNVLLELWPLLARFLRVFLRRGGLKGRKREAIFEAASIAEIVRLYDGADNPIGKSYSKKEFFKLLEAHFTITDAYLHFFPARALPVSIPLWLHRFLDRNMGFMIYANLKK